MTVRILHGDAPHGDRDAAGIWVGLGGTVEAWPADWGNCDADCRHKLRAGATGRRYCPYAGYRRNAAMVESAPALCLAFIRDRSRGATHCAGLAEAAGIRTVRYTSGGER